MNTTAFIKAFNASRNGADNFYRHPLARGVVYSNGIKECCEAGCYWLLDIIATEFPRVMVKWDETLLTINVKVADGKAVIELSGSGDVPRGTRIIHSTDMPDGEWPMLLANDDGEGQAFSLILVSEY
jgi:hypothetical protein